MSTDTTEDKGPQVNAVNYAFLVLSTIAVILRFCGRFVAQKAGFGWDDWLSLVALLFVWAICGLSLYYVSIGLGKHIDQIPGSHSELAKLLLIDNLIYNTGLTVVKMSVLLFYVRVFRIVLVYRVIFWIVAFLIISWGIAINFLAIFACTPVHRYWDPTVPGTCLNKNLTFLGATVPNIVIDFILLVLPIPMLWRLHVETSTKFALVGVFSAGYCVLILSIIRLTSILGIGDKLEKDISYNLAYPQILITIELSIALISSCMPSIFNLVRHGIRNYLPNLFGTLRRSEPLGGPAGAHIGAIGNPIEDKKHKGFMQLESGRSGAACSNERLFDGTDGAVHYTNAYPGQIEAQKEVDGEGGIPLHQIHVRDDIHVQG